MVNGTVGEAAAAAEGLETQFVHGSAALAPSALGRLEQSDRAADVEFALPVELRDLRRQVDAGVLGDEGLQPVADPLSQLLRQREVARGFGRHSATRNRAFASASASAWVKIGVMPMPPASSRYSGRPRLSSK